MYMLRHESHASVTCCTTNHNYCRNATDIFLIFSHYFEKIGEMTTATSATSMTSPDRVAAPPQNHREGTGSRARVTRGREAAANIWRIAKGSPKSAARAQEPNV